MSKGRGLAIIAGASTEIGAFYADRLAALGYQLFLVARRVDRLKELAVRSKAKCGTKGEFLGD